MFGTALIVFREVLEAALIIGVIAAATKGIPARGYWLFGGILLGLAGSAIVAASMKGIAQFADGIGQEIFNASILGVAVLMLAWHSIWMAGHGRALATEARAVGGAIREGQRTLSVLLVVVAVAVLREGAETVLFLYGSLLSVSAVLSTRCGLPARGPSTTPSNSFTPIPLPAPIRYDSPWNCASCSADSSTFAMRSNTRTTEASYIKT